MGNIYTRNYDNMFALAFGAGNLSYSSNVEAKYSVNNLPLKSCNGNVVQPFNKCGMNGCALNISSTGFSGSYHNSLNNPNITFSNSNPDYENLFVCFGGNDRVVSYEDYELVQPYYSSMTVGARSYSSTYDETTHKYVRTCKFVVTYSGTEQITVKEFGVYATVPQTYTISQGFMYSGLPCLIYRETFDTPIILNQNDAIEVTYSQGIIIPHYTDYPIV